MLTSFSPVVFYRTVLPILKHLKIFTEEIYLALDSAEANVKHKQFGLEKFKHLYMNFILVHIGLLELSSTTEYTHTYLYVHLFYKFIVYITVLSVSQTV